MKNTKRILAVLLCVVVVFSVTACGTLANLGKVAADIIGKKQQETTTEAPTERTTEEETTKKESGTKTASAYISGANKELVPEYEHYDPTEFNAGCEELTALSESGKESEALALYDELYAELEYIDSLNLVIYVTYYEDVTNTKNEEEMEYMDELETDSADKFLTACHNLSVGTLSESFKEHVGDDDMFMEYVDYVEMTDEEKELSKRETELCNEYSKISDGMDDFSYVWGGKVYKLGDFYDAESEAFNSIQTEEEYYQILSGCMQGFNAAVGEIYLELIQIRCKIAELNGYDNYADYADVEIYGRDYSSEELEKFEKAVKNCGYRTEGYASYLYYSFPSTEGQAIEYYLDNTGKILAAISPYADSAFKFFTENKLYSIGADENRYSGGFTGSLPYPADANIIYYRLSETVYDLDTLIHEMGHFTDGYFNGSNLVKTMSYDIAEIQSTGLEMLASYMYDTVLDDTDAAIMAGMAVAGTRDSVVSGCLYDEWQRYIYTHPDMTLDEINDKFLELNAAYGCDSNEYVKYQWSSVPHNFESPMYYISYAVSAIMALQIWEQGQTSYEKAAQTWESIIDAGVYGKFMETTENAGLKPITDTNMITEVIEDADTVIENAVYMAYLYEYQLEE